MPAITSGEIRIETVIPIENLQDFSMEIKKDSHAVISLQGFVSQEAGEEALLGTMENADLKVWTGDKLLFRGLIRKVQIMQEGLGYQVFLQGISQTAQLDYEKKNRTFQNSNSTYQEVMREVLKDTSDADLNFYADDRKTGIPLYQIDETNWEFIRRLASHLETSIVPFVLTGRPDVNIGLPVGRRYDQQTIDAYGEKVWFDKEKKSFCRTIRTYEDMELGDQVKWEGLIYTVTDKSCRLDKGLLCFRYILAAKGGFTTKRYENPVALGRLLSAKVLETKDEQVKVKFDIDKFQPVENAFWYPWRPVAGNLMYCMPEKGEQVYIHLGNHEEEQAWAVCGIHGNGKDNPEMQTTDRYFTTSDMKRMYLLPDRMGFQDLKKTSPLGLSLTDDSGISVTSNKNLVISARGTIGMKGSNLFIQAPKEVSLVKRDSFSPTVINMCNGFDSIGATNEVTMADTGNGGFPVFHEYQQKSGKEYSLEGLEKDIIASTPCQTLTNGLEKQIRGIQVDQVGLKEANNKLIFAGGAKG